MNIIKKIIDREKSLGDYSKEDFSIIAINLHTTIFLRVADRFYPIHYPNDYDFHNEYYKINELKESVKRFDNKPKTLITTKIHTT